MSEVLSSGAFILWSCSSTTCKNIIWFFIAWAASRNTTISAALIPCPQVLQPKLFCALILCGDKLWECRLAFVRSKGLINANMPVTFSDATLQRGKMSKTSERTRTETKVKEACLPEEVHEQWSALHHKVVVKKRGPVRMTQKQCKTCWHRHEDMLT